MNKKTKWKPILVKVRGKKKRGLVWNQGYGMMRLFSFDLGATWDSVAKDAWDKSLGGKNETSSV